MLWTLNLLPFKFWNQLQSFEQKIENENILRKREHSTIKNDTLP
jgi:hypothetical protein